MIIIDTILVIAFEDQNRISHGQIVDEGFDNEIKVNFCIKGLELIFVKFRGFGVYHIPKDESDF